MKRNTDKLHPRILELSKELEEDLKLTQMNLAEKTMIVPTIKAKWTQIKFEEERTKKLIEERERKARESYESQFGNENTPRFKTAKEAESSEIVVRLRKAKEDQSEIVRFLDAVVHNIMKDFSYDVSNAIKITQIENS